MIRLWPQGLAGRLVVLLITALAVAQGALVLVLRDEQKSVVETLLHGQALSQTVTLARLLTRSPVAEQDGLLAAFGSRQSCARILDTASIAETDAPDAAESRLENVLGAMLHGVGAGSPRVRLERLDTDLHGCDGLPPWDAAGDRDGAAAHHAGGPHEGRGPRRFSVEMEVPLADGRRLDVRSTMEAPIGWTRTTLLSFLLSAAATAAVVVVAVRRQTRSLRDLADAADRFGRGETVAPLPVCGPREVAVVIGAFGTMQERLGRFVGDRLRLLAAVSHDLRTPLTTLRLKAEFIEDEATRDDIVATIDELTVITEATLAFTRTESTAEKTETVDLAGLVAEVVDGFRLAGGDVVLAAAATVAVPCRPVALRRALRNLIENALRYGLRARVFLQVEDGRAVLTVDDDGPGLPPDRIEEAFKPFVRLEPSRSSETGGIGLGLAIARGIVQAHGGTLVLLNRAEGGLRAEIRLPPRAAEAGGAA